MILARSQLFSPSPHSDSLSLFFFLDYHLKIPSNLTKLKNITPICNFTFPSPKLIKNNFLASFSTLKEPGSILIQLLRYGESN